MTETVERNPRHNYLNINDTYKLSYACRQVNLAFGDYGCYLVGSATRTMDYRDVDVRFIMIDENYDKLFGDCANNSEISRLRYMNFVISEQLSRASGLPVDFQFQRMSDANKEFPGKERGQHLRLALGISFEERTEG